MAALGMGGGGVGAGRPERLEALTLETVQLALGGGPASAP
jgi:hypothetical protein